MRIVAGRLRGRPIAAPAGGRTRPTSDRARETLFNILAHGGFAAPGTAPLPEGARVLDLFAGSGALGLEALSRGAAHAAFVEQDAAALTALRGNIETLGVAGTAQVLRLDAANLGPLPPRVAGAFSLVLLDPPYGRNLVASTLDAASGAGWIAPEAVAVAEIAADAPVPEPAGFVVLDTRRSGPARFVFYRAKAG